MLKVELHCHCKGDPQDYFIKYTPQELIDCYAQLKFDVVAITLHNQLLYTKELVRYAEQKGILLLSGVEKTIEDKHVVILNISEQEIHAITTFEDLRKAKFQNPNLFVIAPHPYHPLVHNLGKKLVENIDLFDAIEWCWYYHAWCNPNRKAEKIAHAYNKPMIGTGDVHFLKYIGLTYSLVHATKDKESVLNALRKRKVTKVTEPLNLFEFVRFMVVLVLLELKRKVLRF